jgi:acyl carrier protein
MGELSVDEITEVIQVMLVEDLYLDVDWSATGVEDGLVDELGLGSLELSELRALCEMRFGVQIEELDFNPVHFHSVGTLAAFVAAQVNQGTAAAQ